MIKHQNKIEKLISKLCPKGVNFKGLSECASIKRGRRVTKSELSPKKNYPVYSGGVTPMGYFEKYNQPANTITIVKYGTAGFVNFITEVFWANDVCYCIKPNDELDNKYLFYVLKAKQDFIQSQATNAIPAHLPTEAIESVKIPVPPLAVQKEIVKILDNFTELEAELEAELGARKKQYEYYRTELLTFNERERERERVRWVTLNEIMDYEQPGKYIVKSTEYSNEHTMPVLTAGKTFILGYTNEINGIYKASDENPVIIFDDFTTSKHWVNFDFKVKSSAMKMLRIKDNVDVVFRYAYYAIKCIQYKPQDHTRQWISTYSEFKIPVPKVAEQKRIVNILDKFDSLINDISIGLPAEISARKSQYEYYRTKLLTFNEYAN